MEGEEVLEVLKQIRDEAKQTNVRLESLEGRLDFLERRTSKGLETLAGRLDSHVERLDVLTRLKRESEVRLASEMLSLAGVPREVRAMIMGSS